MSEGCTHRLRLNVRGSWSRAVAANMLGIRNKNVCVQRQMTLSNTPLAAGFQLLSSTFCVQLAMMLDNCPLNTHKINSCLLQCLTEARQALSTLS